MRYCLEYTTVMKLVVEQDYIYLWYMYYRAVHFKQYYELDFIPC